MSELIQQIRDTIGIQDPLTRMASWLPFCIHNIWNTLGYKCLLQLEKGQSLQNMKDVS